MGNKVLLIFSALIATGSARAAPSSNDALKTAPTKLDSAKNDVPKNEPAKKPGKIVSQVVASARGHAFTSRESGIASMIEYLISDSPSKDLLARPGSSAFDQEVSHTVMDWLADQESQSFKATELTAEEIQNSQRKVVAGVNRSEIVSYWNSLEVTAGEMKNLISRHLNAKKFIGFKSRASYLPITDDEAEAYFKANHGKFGDEPFAKFKDDIKSILSRKRSQERMDEWFSVLQKKYKVRFFPTAKIDS